MKVTARPGRSAWFEYAKTLVGAIALALFIMVFIARAFTVDGPSMLPTLHTGERLLVDKISYRFRDPQRGEIVVFRYPADPSHFYIKRVIGEPGDSVAIRDGKVFVNGQVLREPYIRSLTLGRDAVYTVPAGHYFVLGDNRNNSQDSRSPLVGYVPRSLIIGRALVRYWPVDRARLFTSPNIAEASR